MSNVKTIKTITFPKTFLNGECEVDKYGVRNSPLLVDSQKTDHRCQTPAELGELLREFVPYVTPKRALKASTEDTFGCWKFRHAKEASPYLGYAQEVITICGLQDQVEVTFDQKTKMLSIKHRLPKSNLSLLTAVYEVWSCSMWTLAESAYKKARSKNKKLVKAEWIKAHRAEWVRRAQTAIMGEEAA